jgi:hypothetical protein
MENAIGRFITELATTPVPADIYNQYAAGAPGSEVRRANLRLYLVQMARRRPQKLLVGEAAGHRGCRLTGIPFTSEHILLSGSSGHRLFGAERGYSCSDERQRPSKEQSATIVWDVLSQLSHPPLLWNALPFHPHRPGQPWSNRTPRTSELALGETFLKALLNLYPCQEIIAVGNKAAGCLERWGIAARKVRHPSHGGKAKFSEGILSTS